MADIKKFLSLDGLSYLLSKLTKKIEAVSGSGGLGWNLLTGTRDFGGDVAVADTYERSTDGEGFTVLKTSGDGTWRHEIVAVTDVDAADDAQAGVEAVISADVRATDLKSAPSGYMFVLTIDGTNDGETFTRRLHTDYVFNDTEHCNTADYADGEWVRVTAKFKIPASSDMTGDWGNNTEYRYGVVFSVSDTNTTGTVEIKKLKLEFGSAGTPWVPALGEVLNAEIEEAVAAAQDAADKAQETADAAQKTADEANDLATAANETATLAEAHAEAISLLTTEVAALQESVISLDSRVTALEGGVAQLIPGFDDGYTFECE